LPEPAKLQGALADMFDALVATLSDTRLEPDLHALLWSLVNVFHRRIDRIARDLDANESAQRMGQREQDGSVELERLVAQGLTLIERRNSFEFIRDAAAELYGLHTGQAWRPARFWQRPGVKVPWATDIIPRSGTGLGAVNAMEVSHQLPITSDMLAVRRSIVCMAKLIPAHSS
jgi:hypothetical protein